MNDDLISRQAVLSVLVFADETKDMTCKDMRNVLDAINAIPSAESKRKKEKWVGDCCSCCGVSKYNYIKMVDDECGPFGTWNFCPNCGADMRTKGNENV